MKTLSRFQLALTATVIALFALPFASYALVSYPPGSLLQPGDVATSTIRNYAVSPAKIASGLDFTMHGLTTTNATSTNAIATSLTVTGATTSFNGITYTMPSTQSAAGGRMQNDGTGKLSWIVSSNSSLDTSLTSATTTAISTPAAVYVESTTAGYLGFDTSGIAQENTAWGGTQSTTLTLASHEHEGVFATFIDYAGTLTGVVATGNGATMTLIGSATGTGAGSGKVYIFFGNATTTGDFPVTVTASGSTSTYYNLGATAYYNIAATQGEYAAANGATSITGSTVTNTSYMGVAGMEATNCSPAVGTNFTARSTGSGALWFSIGDNNAYITPAGAVTQTMTGVSCGALSMAQWSIAPYIQPYYGFDETSAVDAGHSETFVGFITTSPASATTQNVTTFGQLTGFSGLTPGSVYYLGNNSGTISTTAGTVSHKVGVSLSATDLLIQQEP